MNQLLKQGNRNKIKMKVCRAHAHEMEIEWMANVVFDSRNLPLGVIITTKKLNYE